MYITRCALFGNTYVCVCACCMQGQPISVAVIWCRWERADCVMLYWSTRVSCCTGRHVCHAVLVNTGRTRWHKVQYQLLYLPIDAGSILKMSMSSVGGQITPVISEDIKVHTHTCAHTYTHMHTHTHTHTYIHTHMHTHIHAHTYTHTCTHTCTHTYVHTHMHTHMHTLL